MMLMLSLIVYVLLALNWIIAHLCVPILYTTHIHCILYIVCIGMSYFMDKKTTTRRDLSRGAFYSWPMVSD